MAGLLGMGGLGGLNNSAPAGLLKGNLAALFNPTSMRNQQIKQGLLNAGMAMMNPDPHAPPAGFGGMLGRAAAGGIQGAHQAKNDFYNDGMMNMQLMQFQQEQDQQAQQSAAMESLIPTLPPDIQAFARAYPKEFGEAWMKAKVGGGNGPEYGLNPIWAQDEQNNWQLYQPNKQGGDPQRMQFPPGVSPQPSVSFQDLGTSVAPYATKGGGPVGEAIPKDIRGKAAEDKIGEVAGKAAVDLPRAKGTMDRAIKSIEVLRNHPGRQMATGLSAWFGGGMIPGEGYDFKVRLDQAKGQAFLEAYNVLKGGGQITEIEGQKATDAIAAMDRAQTEDQFLSALADFEDAIRTGYAKLAEQASMVGGGAGSASDPLGIR